EGGASISQRDENLCFGRGLVQRGYCLVKPLDTCEERRFMFVKDQVVYLLHVVLELAQPVSCQNARVPDYGLAESSALGQQPSGNLSWWVDYDERLDVCEDGLDCG